MPNVLLLETGVGGGGSFESLVLHATSLRTWRAVAVFVNSAPHVDRLRRHGVETHVLSDLLYSEGTPAVIRRSANAIVGRLRGRPYLSARRLLHRPLVTAVEHIIRESSIDILHTNDQPLRDLFAVDIARRTGCALVGDIRSARGVPMDPACAQFLDRGFQRYIAVSEAAKSHWVHRGLNASKIKVLHNAVTSPPVPFDVRVAFGLPAAARVVGCVANLVPVKRHDVLIEAFRRMASSRPDAYLVLVGDGPLHEEIESMVQVLGLGGRVRVVGHRADARALLGSFDILALASDSEACPRVLLEAMVAGVPVVATRVGGVPELVDDGVSGLLTPPGDAVAMASALGVLLDDPAMARAMGAAAGHRASTDFRVEHRTTSVEAIYREVMTH